MVTGQGTITTVETRVTTSGPRGASQPTSSKDGTTLTLDDAVSHFIIKDLSPYMGIIWRELYLLIWASIRESSISLYGHQLERALSPYMGIKWGELYLLIWTSI